MRLLTLMLLIAAGSAACTVIFGDGKVTNSVNRELDVTIPDPRKVEPLKK